MTKRKERAFETEAELLAVVNREPGHRNPLRRAALEKLRYRRNGAHRLDLINRARVRKGIQTVNELHEAKIRIPA